jgi:hypothetical protein
MVRSTLLTFSDNVPVVGPKQQPSHWLAAVCELSSEIAERAGPGGLPGWLGSYYTARLHQYTRAVDPESGSVANGAGGFW